MSREDDNIVLCAIGQLTLKTEDDNPEQLESILRSARKNRVFSSSPYGQEYIRKTADRLKQLSSDENAAFNAMIRRSDKKTEDLFRDLDESLFQMASQHTARNTEKLVWFVLALSLINTIALFFIALFVWNLNMV